VKAAAHSTSDIQFVPYKQAYDADFEDMPRRIPDISKLRNLVGFRPRVLLPEIIDRTIDYWRQREGLESAAARSTVERGARAVYEPKLSGIDVGVTV
jgi:UDP-glucose 4-epimerase